MSDNNTMYRMFRQMIQGYKLGKEGDNLFTHAVHCWMDLNPENPFVKESEAYDYFFRMKNYYNVWKLHSADYRINEKRMLAEARKLCELKPKNPYKFDKKADEQEKAALRESAMQEQEEAMILAEKEKQEMAEKEEIVRQVREEILADDLENQQALAANQAIVESAKAEVIQREKANQESKKPVYVFNVKEEQEKKKGFLSKLFRR